MRQESEPYRRYRLLALAAPTLYGGGWEGSPIPTTPPRNGRFSRSALEVIFVGRVGKAAPSSAAGTLARTSSGEATVVHAGSQYPQNPVPGACSISPPKRRA